MDNSIRYITSGALLCEARLWPGSGVEVLAVSPPSGGSSPNPRGVSVAVPVAARHVRSRGHVELVQRGHDAVLGAGGGPGSLGSWSWGRLDTASAEEAPPTTCNDNQNELWDRKFTSQESSPAPGFCSSPLSGVTPRPLPVLLSGVLPLPRPAPAVELGAGAITGGPGARPTPGILAKI